MKTRFLALPLLLALAATSFGQHFRPQKETVLYVWASDQAHLAPDFLAVIDFDQDSWTYGSVITDRAASAAWKYRQ